MDILEASGAVIAFPTSTMRLTRESGGDAAKVQAAIATVKRWREAGDLPFPNDRPERITEFRNTLAYPSLDSALAPRPSGSTGT
jgi:MscS family membrane protein